MSVSVCAQRLSGASTDTVGVKRRILVLGAAGLGIVRQLAEVKRRLQIAPQRGYSCVAGCSSGAFIAVILASVGLADSPAQLAQLQIDAVDDFSKKLKAKLKSVSLWSAVTELLNIGSILCSCCFASSSSIVADKAWREWLSDLFPDEFFEKVMRSDVGLCINMSDYHSRRPVYYFKVTPRIDSMQLMRVIRPDAHGGVMVPHSNSEGVVVIRGGDANVLSRMTQASASISGVFVPVRGRGVCGRDEGSACVENDEFASAPALLCDGAYTDNIPHVIPNNLDEWDPEYIVACETYDSDQPASTDAEYIKNIFVPGYAVALTAGQRYLANSMCVKDTAFINMIYTVLRSQAGAGSDTSNGSGPIQLNSSAAWSTMTGPFYELKHAADA